MSKIADGGPAACDMSLRDLFAGLFLHAIVLKEGSVADGITRSMAGEDRVRDARMFARDDTHRAYIYADAMLAARKAVKP